MISEHLSEVEFLSSRHVEWAFDQQDIWDHDANLRARAARFAREVFEPVREVLAVPLYVTSGFRCPGLNAAVKGKANSMHLLGLACDVIPVELDVRPAMFALLRAVKDGRLPMLDKAILECGTWLHIQAAVSGEPARHLALETPDGATFSVLS